MNYIVILYFSILMRLPRLSPTRPLGHSGSLKVQQEPGVGLAWLCGSAGTPSLLTHQFQAKPCRGSRRGASIIERIDLGCASNLMRVLISLTVPPRSLQWLLLVNATRPIWPYRLKSMHNRPVNAPDSNLFNASST